MMSIASSHPDLRCVDVSAGIWRDVSDGVARGLYERFGGASRDVASRQIVAWLCEGAESGAPLSTDIGVDPEGVMKRLDTIQEQLSQVQQVLETIDDKIDLLLRELSGLA